MRTVGVEEEFLLADPGGDRACPVATRVVRIAASRDDVGGPAGAMVRELQEQQLEVYTSPQVSMSMLESELRALRLKANRMAREVGTRVVASGTCPVPVEPRRVRTARYDAMAARFGILTREHLTCGCHVHVSVASQDEAIGVLDRIRVWLPSLLALSANSPFWQGRDTGFASFRWPMLSRWPVSGPTEVFGTGEAYAALVHGLLAADVLLDQGMLYFDARSSQRYPTVEIRIADECVDVRDAVLVAALCRALVETCAREWAAGQPPPAVSTMLLRLATWQAARWGIGAQLLDPWTLRRSPASDVIGALVDYVRPALCRSGDQVLVDDGIDRVMVRGNGATRQRDVFAKTGRLRDVLTDLMRGTAGHEP